MSVLQKIPNDLQIIIAKLLHYESLKNIHKQIIDTVETIEDAICKGVLDYYHLHRKSKGVALSLYMFKKLTYQWIYREKVLCYELKTNKCKIKQLEDLLSENFNRSLK